jgi:hypothetical protein
VSGLAEKVQAIDAFRRIRRADVFDADGNIEIGTIEGFDDRVRKRFS